jgi:hypothetical protein
MKYILAGQTVLIIALIAFLAIKTKSNRELNDYIGVQKHKIKAIRAQRDSIEGAIRLTRDSLEIVYQVFETQRRIAAKAEMDRKEIQKKYENIVFKSFANDSLRMRELSNLYNSIGNP